MKVARARLLAAVVGLLLVGASPAAAGPRFVVVQGSPCNLTAAPYFALLTRETHSTVNSIYRGDDARGILRAHGKHTQRELYKTLPTGVANPPGRSTHELRSDGVAYPGPIGRKLQWWQQGIDVNDNNVLSMILDARWHNWLLWQPYKAGVEWHHLNFRKRPIGRAVDRPKLIRLRATLPRR
jgi:hypothetical protein